MQILRFSANGAATFAVLATTLFVTSLANGQKKGTPSVAPVAPPVTSKVGNRALERTAFEINPDLLTASCATSGCSARKAVFIRTAQCDGGAGTTCTLYLHIDSQLGVSNFDDGQLRFLIDALPPNPGPSDHGFVSWNEEDPNSGDADLEVHSFSVVAFVKNQTTNQQHDIEVDVQCDDINSDGCTIVAGFATLQAVVYTP